MKWETMLWERWADPDCERHVASPIQLNLGVKITSARPRSYNTLVLRVYGT